MPWNGSGGFSRDNGTNTGLTVWQDDSDAGTKIRADNHDTHDQDIADGVQACLAKNGENAMTGNLDMGSNKITAAAAGSLASDVPNISQVQSGAIKYAADTGAANAYLVSLSPAAASYSAGIVVRMKAGNSNTAASTVNVNGLGVKNIFLDGAALTGGEIIAGDMVELQYDGTQFHISSFPRRKRVSGAASDSSGPHFDFKFDGDSHSPLQILAWAHDNISIAFDARYDGANWISGDPGSNYMLSKASDKFSVFGVTGVAAGSSISWTERLYCDATNNVVLPNDSNGTSTGMLKVGDSGDIQIYHHSTVSYIDSAGPTSFTVRNTTADKNLILSAKNTGGTQRDVVELHGSDGATFYVDGTETVDINATGMRVPVGTINLGATTEMEIDTTAADPSISADKTNGDFAITNKRDGRSLVLKASTTGGVLKNLLFGNADNFTQLYHNGTWKIRTDATGVLIDGAVYPQTDDLYDLGSGSRRWDDIWATNTTIQTSDLRQKTDVSPISMGGEFIDALNPVNFRWINGKRRHNGLIAQEVEQTLLDLKVSTNDFAGFVRAPLLDEGGAVIGDRLGVRIGEFIPAMMKNLQESNEKIRVLERKNAALEVRIAKIEANLSFATAR